MPQSHPEIISQLKARFGETVPMTVIGEGRSGRVISDREHLLPLLEALKSHPELPFDVLTDLTAVDYLHLQTPGPQGTRFTLVYQLYSTFHNYQVRIAARIPEDDLIAPSVAGLWPSAVWAEREVFDLFGIEFDDHPELRRLLLPEAYPGFPLRKEERVRGPARRGALIEKLRSPASGPEVTRASRE